MDKYKVKITFTETLLGTVAKDKELYASYIASKAPAEVDTGDEIETVQQMEQSGWTGFHVLPDGRPCLYNYTWKGHFKDVASMMRRVDGTLSGKLTAHKKVIDGLVFVFPRQIPLILPEGASMGVLERPLRAQTAQGERIALARSDTCPPGTVQEFELTVLGEITEPILREWFDYGALRGTGQWRNAGWGTYAYELTKVS